ncbi:MAG: sugar ABC transporter substrate-binding protein [Clostridia bacterium]|jgi:multiple sugar transport system substrate-binding protein|nr:sugar ABC transporter substrate-binding protein [Clostridia bacterium]
MKRIITAIVIMSVCFLPVFASGQGESSDSGVTTIQWFTPNWDEEESEELVAQFEQENPDIRVELVITEWESYKTKAITALSGKDSPELFSVLLTDVKGFQNKHLIAPIGELTTAAGLDWSDILVKATDIVSVDGEPYAVPFRYDGNGVYYNKAILSEYGFDSFPETYAELEELHAAIKAGGKYTATGWGFGDAAGVTQRLAQQLYSFDGEFFNEDYTQCLLDSKEAKKTMNFLVDTIQKGYALSSSVESNGTALRNHFGAGSIAYYMAGPFDVPVIQESFPDIDFGTAMLPGDGHIGVTTADGWCVVLGENANNKEEAARFQAFLARPENQAYLTDTFPASYKALEQEAFSTEYLIPFAEQLDYSKPAPTYERWAEIEPIIFSYVQEAMSGHISADEACDAMKSEIDQMLSL